MIKRAIVTYPQFDNLPLIEQLRHQYDPLTAVIAPHLTLVFPFESDLSAADLHSHIRHAIQGIGPFPIRLHGITGSEGQYLLLNVKQGNDPLIELHDRLYTGPLAAHLWLEHTYIPHLTVGRLSDRSAYLNALTAVQEVTVTFQTIITEIEVFHLDNGRSLDFKIKL